MPGEMGDIYELSGVGVVLRLHAEQFREEMLAANQLFRSSLQAMAKDAAEESKRITSSISSIAASAKAMADEVKGTVIQQAAASRSILEIQGSTARSIVALEQRKAIDLERIEANRLANLSVIEARRQSIITAATEKRITDAQAAAAKLKEIETTSARDIARATEIINARAAAATAARRASIEANAEAKMRVNAASIEARALAQSQRDEGRNQARLDYLNILQANRKSLQDERFARQDALRAEREEKRQLAAPGLAAQRADAADAARDRGIFARSGPVDRMGNSAAIVAGVGATALTGIPLIASNSVLGVQQTYNNTGQRLSGMNAFVGDVFESSTSKYPYDVSVIANAKKYVTDEGFSAKADMESLLDAANKLTLATGGDFDKNTLAIASTLANFGLKASYAQRLSGMMFKASGVGNTSVPEMADAGAKFFQTAAQAKLAPADAIAAFAALTRTGIGTSETATALRAFIRGDIHMKESGHAYAKNIKEETGIDLPSNLGSATALSRIGLLGTAKILNEAAAKGHIALPDLIYNLFSNRTGATAIATLASQIGVKNYGEAYKSESQDAELSARSSVSMSSLTVQAQLLKNGLLALAKELSDAGLLQTISSAASNLRKMVAEFRNMPQIDKKILIGAVEGITAISAIFALIAKLFVTIAGAKILMKLLGFAGKGGSAAEATAAAGTTAAEGGEVAAAAGTTAAAVAGRGLFAAALRNAASVAAGASPVGLAAASIAGTLGYGAKKIAGQYIAASNAEMEGYNIPSVVEVHRIVTQRRKSVERLRNEYHNHPTRANLEKFNRAADLLDSARDLVRMISGRPLTNSYTNMTEAGAHVMAGLDKYKNIKTPLGEASCAYFASEYLIGQGAKIHRIGNAAELVEKLHHLGAVQLYNNRNIHPGDFLDFHGPGYGKVSGHHSAIYIGKGMLMESSGDGPGHQHIRRLRQSEFSRMSAYALPNSLFGDPPNSDPLFSPGNFGAGVKTGEEMAYDRDAKARAIARRKRQVEAIRAHMQALHNFDAKHAAELKQTSHDDNYTYRSRYTTDIQQNALIRLRKMLELESAIYHRSKSIPEKIRLLHHIDQIDKQIEGISNAASAVHAADLVKIKAVRAFDTEHAAELKQASHDSNYTYHPRYTTDSQNNTLIQLRKNLELDSAIYHRSKSLREKIDLLLKIDNIDKQIEGISNSASAAHAADVIKAKSAREAKLFWSDLESITQKIITEANRIQLRKDMSSLSSIRNGIKIDRSASAEFADSLLDGEAAKKLTMKQLLGQVDKQGLGSSGLSEGLRTQVEIRKDEIRLMAQTITTSMDRFNAIAEGVRSETPEVRKRHLAQLSTIAGHISTSNATLSHMKRDLDEIVKTGHSELQKMRRDEQFKQSHPTMSGIGIKGKFHTNADGTQTESGWDSVIEQALSGAIGTLTQSGNAKAEGHGFFGNLLAGVGGGGQGAGGLLGGLIDTGLTAFLGPVAGGIANMAAGLFGNLFGGGHKNDPNRWSPPTPIAYSASGMQVWVGPGGMQTAMNPRAITAGVPAQERATVDHLEHRWGRMLDRLEHRIVNKLGQTNVTIHNANMGTQKDLEKTSRDLAWLSRQQLVTRGSTI